MMTLREMLTDLLMDKSIDLDDAVDVIVFDDAANNYIRLGGVYSTSGGDIEITPTNKSIKKIRQLKNGPGF